MAWKVYAAQCDWISRVDTKSSIVLSLEVAMLGFVITLSGKGRLLAGLTGAHLQAQHLGVLSTGIALVLAARVVAPRLGNPRNKNKTDFIYFGHLRHWPAKELRDHLANFDEDDELDMLSRQLVILGQIAWAKHRWLQWSVALAVIGGALLSFAGTYGS